LFFVDIGDKCLDYRQIIKILKLHSAHVALFLSKDVTHVIRIKKHPINNKYTQSTKNQPYSRGEKMVQLALKSQTPNSKESSVQHTYTVLTPNVVMSFSVKCSLGFNHLNNNKSTIEIASNEMAKADVNVRELQGYYIKIEDEAGIYRPLITEMTEWPELHFDSDTPFCYPKVKRTPFSTKQWRKRKLCELCNKYYSVVEHHVNGAEHQANAGNDKLFARIDALIAAGPTN
jgi:hypothetical protein